jgi:GNAT superfamily N-acetyltransferase
VIREAEERDVEAIVALVHELADYERAAEHCTLTADQLRTALFGAAPALFGHVAEIADDNGEGTVVGCALWFVNFSTWRGVHGIYLEDLYVQPAHRGAGLGRALLARLAAVCTARGLARLEWAVLDWNTPSIGFYRSIRAAAMDDWTVFRLDGTGLAALAAEGAASDPPGPPPSTTAATAR